MGNFMVTVIAIALIAVTVLAGAYYGGRAMNEYSKDAYAARLISEGEQIAGALALYRVEVGALPEGTSLQFLEDTRYISEIPPGAEVKWRILSDEIRTPIGSDSPSLEKCQVARTKLGYTGDPLPCYVPGTENDPEPTPNPDLPPRDPCCMTPD